MKYNISFLSRSLAVTLFSFTVLTVPVAQATDSQSYTINLTATVPSDSFMVIPVETGWIAQTQDMGYDIAISKLQVFERQFQYKNTTGGIQATLTGNLNTDGKPQLANGSGDLIPLSVTFNNVLVTSTAATVVTADAAKAGGRTDLRITQAEDKPLEVNGSFSGSVALIFEPAVAVPEA